MPDYLVAVAETDLVIHEYNGKERVKIQGTTTNLVTIVDGKLQKSPCTPEQVFLDLYFSESAYEWTMKKLIKLGMDPNAEWKNKTVKINPLNGKFVAYRSESNGYVNWDVKMDAKPTDPIDDNVALSLNAKRAQWCQENAIATTATATTVKPPVDDDDDIPF